MKIGLQLYSVRDEMEKDFLGTLRRVKEMGYAGAELAGLFGYTPARVREMFDEVGLVPISAHVPVVEMQKDLNGVVAAYREIGCRFVVVPYLPPESRYGSEGYGEVVETIRRAGLALAEVGITLLYHNHDFEFEKDEAGRYVLDALYEDVPASLLQTEIDTCWVHVAGVDPAAYIRKYSGRAPIVHLKDYNGVTGKNMYKLIGIDTPDEKEQGFEFRPFGHGVQDVPALLAASRDAGAEWVIVEQDEPALGYDRLTCAEMSYKALALHSV